MPDSTGDRRHGPAAARWSYRETAAALDQLLSLNPRPFELVTILISSLSAAMIFINPRAFGDNANFALLETAVQRLCGPSDEWFWGALFAAFALAHAAAMIYDLRLAPAAQRYARRGVMFFKMFFSAVVMFACFAAAPFGPADIVYFLYCFCSVCAYLQLFFGRA